MAFLDKLRQLFRYDGVPSELKAAGLSPEVMRKLGEELEKEVARPPRIALIGETGVGKTSTINALFNKGLEISHTRACTQFEVEIVGDRGGEVRVFDMPGLGEDIESDKAHFDAYRRIVPEVDVTVWILKADNRAMTHVQAVLQRLVNEEVLQPDRLVVALNQVDLLQPGAWDTVINQPSPEQEKTIAARRADVVEKLRQVIKLPNDRIVAYSALKFYSLEPLFEAMLHACEERRRWVLFERASCADFNQLVDAGAGAE